MKRKSALGFLVVAGVVALGAGCSDTSASSDGPAITGLFWIDGADSEQPLTVSKTIDLPKSAKAIQESDYTVVAQPDLSANGVPMRPVGEGFLLAIEYTSGETSAETGGMISRGTLVRGTEEIVLYAGNGEVDNLEVVVQGDRIVWAELSDSDTAATWDWSIKSMQVGENESKVIATATDLNNREEVPVVVQDLHLSLSNNNLYWSPLFVEGGELVQGVFYSPVDASTPASSLFSDVSLVRGDSADLFMQKVEGLDETSDEATRSIILDLKTDVADGIIENSVNAELLGHAGKDLLFTVEGQYYLANVESREVIAITGVTGTSNDVSVCGTRIYFQDPKTNEGEMGTHYVLNAEDGSVVSVTSPLAISCSGDSALWIPEHEPTESVLVNWKK